MAASLRHLLEQTSAFVTVAELVTSGGLITAPSGRQIVSLARALAEHPRFHASSVTDNPGGLAIACDRLAVYHDGSLRGTGAWDNAFQNRNHRKKSSAS